MIATAAASEHAMVEAARRRLARHAEIAVRVEVPLCGRFIDLVYVTREQVCTVEFKLTSWRRALTQATDHLLGADWAYVCMPRRPITDEMRDAFAQAGVGLLFPTAGGEWPFETVIDAQDRHTPWEVARQQLLQVAARRAGEALDTYV